VKREGFGLCKLCGELLLPGEPRSPSVFDGEEVHLECGFRAVVGSANHILHLCSCYGGKAPHDSPKMSKREEARHALKVFKWVQELREVMPRYARPDGRREG
jgi:hypothetical protein